jgi:choline dehydrogenase
MMQEQEFDVIVVGGGTAGALCARRLGECVPASVLVLEAGPPFPSWALGVPLASYRLRRPWSWEHRSVPQAALGGRRILYPMGKVLGGSSSVNAMIAARGPAADYDAWAAEGCAGWNWQALEPCWRRATDRSRAGAVAVEHPAFTAPFTDALVRAFQEYGLAHVDALTGEESQTCGRFAVFQRSRMRYSTARALTLAEPGGRLVVRSRARVRRILFEHGRAVGVECGDAKAAFAIRARGGVVLSAGVFGSPAILMRSGVGPAERIREAGIEPLRDLPGVGENLQDHVGVPVIWGSLAPSPGRKSRWIPAAIEYAVSRTGVMASNGCEGGAFLGTAGQSPDLEIAAMFQSFLRPRAVELSAIVMHPRSRGVVALDPRQPFGPPLIDPRFLSSPDDMRRLREGVDAIRDVASQPSLRSFGLTRELLPGRIDVGEHIRDHASTHYHPVGTCRMGRDAGAVVDPSLAVHGLRNLWVCDNSVVPRLPAGHSAATAMLIGERGADLIAGQLAAG